MLDAAILAYKKTSDNPIGISTGAVFMETDELLLYLVVIQQLHCHSCILGTEEVYLLKHTELTESYVFKVAYRRSYDIEYAAHVCSFPVS